ncbi:hypothetical protein [Altererythrobacter sp. MTPC7]|uniref:hypothetical protein n=1 Tax=Altererythrobacter sp. MTPC7 TaxID=3056567 RepID=UPI0036F41811
MLNRNSLLWKKNGPPVRRATTNITHVPVTAMAGIQNQASLPSRTWSALAPEWMVACCARNRAIQPMKTAPCTW